MSTTLVKKHALVNGEVWELAWTPAACVCLQEVADVKLIEFIRHLRPGSPKEIYQCFYALRESQRQAQGIDLNPRLGFKAALNHFPVFDLSSPTWLNFEALVFELVSENFFGRSWAEMTAIRDAAMAEAQDATTESTSTPGPTSATPSSTGETLTPSGTESTSDTSPD